MSSLSRDYYWSEDQVSLSSSVGVNHDDVIEAVGSQNGNNVADIGILCAERESRKIFFFFHFSSIRCFRTFFMV